MWINREEYHNELREAYIKGLEQGFLLSRKLSEIASRRERAEDPLSDSRQTQKPPAFLQQIIDIAKRRGVDYE